MTDKHNVRLGVNIDHVGTLRNARGARYPDPIHAAGIAERSGADGITIHLREDRRHITDRDVALLSQTLTVPMNLEMALTEAMVDVAESVEPECVCIVPERRQELTTEGGLDLVGQSDRLEPMIQRLLQIGTQVSLFIDPDIGQIQAAKALGVGVVEIHTGDYSEADASGRPSALQRVADAVVYAKQQGLIVNAGHGLHYQNVLPIAALPVYELNIGHSIIARALFDGLAKAVADMKTLICQSGSGS